MLSAKDVDVNKSKSAKKFVLARDLALLVSEDLLPFSIVEGGGFKRFLVRKGIVSSEKEIPARTTISRNALDDAYDAVRNIILRQMPTEFRYHVSTDTWTDRYRKFPYIAVVLHFLNEEFELKCISLKTDYFEGPHTASAIREEVVSTLKNFEIDEKQMFAAITDSASNMVSGFRNFIHIRCADHRMHRALTKDFYETSTGRKVLQLRSQLMRMYKHLLYKKTYVSKVAKERQQDNYLDSLRKAQEIEQVTFFTGF